MIAACRDAGAPEPLLRVDDTGIWVELRFGKAVSKAESKAESPPEALNVRVLRLLGGATLGKAALAAALGKPMVSGDLNAAVRGLHAEKLIALTLPEKPTSRLQAYRITAKQGLRYGTIETPEKYYLTWKEEHPDWRPGGDDTKKYLTEAHYPKGQRSPLDRALRELCDKARFLELVHDFIVFDAGTKSSVGTTSSSACARPSATCVGGKAGSSGTPSVRERA